MIKEGEINLLNWCFTHPWMTFFILLATIEAIENIIKYLTHYHKTTEELKIEQEENN